MAIKRVICAISGGIDSAVSAYLLKRKGYNVTGLFMKNWDYTEEGISDCPRTKDFADAQQICRILDIELHEVNFIKEYWNHVFQPFLNNYKQGRAIVPDVNCNTSIKFGLLYDYVFDKLNADAIATGHYARNSYGDYLEKKHDGPPKLLRSKDPVKDQTYFLANISSNVLKNTMFPVGSFYKSHVQKIAADLKLQFLLEKKESMGICFIGKRKNFSEFLNQYVEPNPGPIIFIKNGKEIGGHYGIHNYTLGKRVTVPIEKYQSHDGLFVSKLDYENQIVYVCEGSYHPSLFAKSFELEEINWITKPKNKTGCVHISLQRNQPPLQAKIDGNLIIPSRPVRAAAIGQMCVLYEGEVCLGGAEIKQVIETL